MISEKLVDIKNEVDTQEDIINSIALALNGKAVAGDSIDYLGKTETNQEVTTITMNIPDGYSEFWIKECHYPNSSGLTGWVGVWLGSTKINSVYPGVDGSNASNKQVYSMTHLKIKNSQIIEYSSLRSQNTTSANATLATPVGLDVNIVFKSDFTDIKSIQSGGYQSGVLGVGSYIEVWGAK